MASVIKGSSHNVHQGEGEDAEYLMADLLIMDESTIEAVQKGKVEISLGYDAEYTQVSPGKGFRAILLLTILH